MASPQTYNRQILAPPSSTSTGPAPGQFTSGTTEAGIAHADRIPPYVGGIILLSAATLFILHKAKFRMIVGAG